MTTKCEYCGSRTHSTCECHWPKHPSIPAANHGDTEMTIQKFCKHCGSRGNHVCYPEYPSIPAAKKFRAIPRNELTTEQSIAYSAAIVSTVRRLQNAWWRNERAIDPPHCASGTFSNSADDIEAAVRARHSRNLSKPQSLISSGGFGAVNRERTDEELRQAYAAAMRAKRTAAEERAASSCAEGARAA